MKIEALEENFKNEYEVERKVGEFREWASKLLPEKFQTHEKFHKHRVVKKIIQEVLPINAFIISNPLKFTKLKLIYGNQSHDGLAWNDQEYFSEVTTVQDGELHFFQAKHLDKFGSAPGTGVSAKGFERAFKNNERVQGEAIDAEAEIDKTAQQEYKAIELKNAINYPPSTILIISIYSDVLMFDKKWERLCSKCSAVSLGSFTKIYIVNINRNYCFELEKEKVC